jgi:hypothetical protein
MPVLTANTQVTLCIECSGTTTTVIPPNPTYSSTKSGDTVVQANLILIGGRNGYNS